MHNKQTVLIADDDLSIRNMLADELEASYEVLVAKDGIDAICIYERNVQRVRAIITDLQMPRLDGELVAEWVHHINPRLPVIIMSGSLRNLELQELLKNPTITFLAKPFNPRQLEALLDVALERLEAA
ncbi:MAG TPA: response regulator [Pyrinomonadaceae bacterium]